MAGYDDEMYERELIAESAAEAGERAADREIDGYERDATKLSERISSLEADLREAVKRADWIQGELTEAQGRAAKVLPLEAEVERLRGLLNEWVGQHASAEGLLEDTKNTLTPASREERAMTEHCVHGIRLDQLCAQCPSVCREVSPPAKPTSPPEAAQLARLRAEVMKVAGEIHAKDDEEAVVVITSEGLRDWAARLRAAARTPGETSPETEHPHRNGGG